MAGSSAYIFGLGLLGDEDKSYHSSSKFEVTFACGNCTILYIIRSLNTSLRRTQLQQTSLFNVVELSNMLYSILTICPSFFFFLSSQGFLSETFPITRPDDRDSTGLGYEIEMFPLGAVCRDRSCQRPGWLLLDWSLQSMSIFWSESCRMPIDDRGEQTTETVCKTTNII
jgi:hypothetical protein